jgi:hypothetical protein
MTAPVIGEDEQRGLLGISLRHEIPFGIAGQTSAEASYKLGLALFRQHPKNWAIVFMDSTEKFGRNISTQVEILIAEAKFPRQSEPVTCGIPWPRGALIHGSLLRMRDAQNNLVTLQHKVLDRWPDGSIRWLLLDWQAFVQESTTYKVGIDPVDETVSPNGVSLRAIKLNNGIKIDTGVALFQIEVGGRFPFKTVRSAGVEIIDPDRTRFTIEDEVGRFFEPRIQSVNLEEQGPIRIALCITGDLFCDGIESLGRFMARLHFSAGSGTVRFEITIHNPRKAEHPGGLWDLGDGGSIYLRDASLTVALPKGAGKTAIRCSPETAAPFESFDQPLEIYQDSSGGQNWKSTNHLNRRRVVPNTFCGYRLRAGGSERTGKRATPVLVLDRDDFTLAMAMPHFWQNFPKAMEASADTLVLRLFPSQYADVHEIQGGEQKNHGFFVAFGPDKVADETLAWCRSPLLPKAAPSWYCSTEAVPYLIPKAEDPNTVYLKLVDSALDGPDSFDHKREVIDEFGWRHFGDLYGDHEAVFHTGPTPLISHYNNQYDPIAGFAFQFLRSGDSRWWQHMDQLAAHVIDIDIYHTELDKAAYNHGLFWHTYHYTDADTGTHRSYPRRGAISAGSPQTSGAADLPWSPQKGKVSGGGPANEQNYTTGLVLHYFLTGSPLSRQTVLELGRWVIDMDDGRRTPFRWLAGGYTGMASSSGSPNYHGPGRGAGNSANALLDVHRLTDDVSFLDKAEQLIRRCIHPADDIPSRRLLDAERRWYYTVFLQALGRYLDYKVERGDLDFMYAYAQASLLHYARWMAEHEYPFLDKPEILEYPTETWAAQDMRKSEVFKYAAKHAAGEERARFLERAEFFFRSSTGTLAKMKTRSLTRPVVLMLSYGFMHASFQKHPETTAPSASTGPHEFGCPEVFIPQKIRAKKRFLYIVASAGAIMLAAILVLAWSALR